MYKRQKLLLALLEKFGAKLSNTDMQKLLFLYNEIYQFEKSYHFVPYKYGCFSFQSYADKRRLTDLGYIANEEDWQLVTRNESYIDSLNEKEKFNLGRFNRDFNDISGNRLIEYVYRNYPYYAINSEIAHKILSKSDLKRIEAVKPVNNKKVLYTIGYEGISLECFINKLIKEDVQLLCDVRKNALSRKYGFSKSSLNNALERVGIEYRHYPELGIVSEKRKHLVSQTDYNTLFSEYKNNTLSNENDILDELHQLINEKRRIALTCFENKPHQCHRSWVAKAITQLPKWNGKLINL